MQISEKDIGRKIFDPKKEKFGIIARVDYDGDRDPIGYYYETDADFNIKYQPHLAAGPDAEIFETPILEIIETGVKIVFLIDGIWPILKKWFRDVFGSREDRKARKEARRKAREEKRKERDSVALQKLSDGLRRAGEFLELGSELVKPGNTNTYGALEEYRDILSPEEYTKAVIEALEDEPEKAPSDSRKVDLTITFPGIPEDTDLTEFDGEIFRATISKDKYGNPGISLEAVNE